MGISKLKKPGELLNWEDIQKMEYYWNVACEVLRLSPPSLGSFREAVNDFVFSGFSIPKGLEDAQWHCRGDVKKALTFAGYKKAFGTAAAKVAEQMCKGVGKGQSLAADFILMWKVENLPFEIAIAHHLISS
ncbi:hypothetical protein LWI28_024189 [Acer negundo]|uniref:Uncharacterized protein n=1 Tax=Acer negundo TaxID=4023 RepID=A0AAD5NWJ6_ACENE|nr:hypothetical protein LWI28_024189 [Acer negundo]